MGDCHIYRETSGRMFTYSWTVVISLGSKMWGGILCFLSPFLYFFKIISKGLCPFIKRKSSKALFILKMIMISFHLEISFHWEISFHLEVSFHLEMIISDKEWGQGEGRGDEAAERKLAITSFRENNCRQDLELESVSPAFQVSIMCTFMSLRNILQEAGRSTLRAGHWLRLFLTGLANLSVPFARALPSPGVLLFPLGREAV